MRLRGCEKCLTICLAISTQSISTTSSSSASSSSSSSFIGNRIHERDRQTDGQTDGHSGGIGHADWKSRVTKMSTVADPGDLKRGRQSPTRHNHHYHHHHYHLLFRIHERDIQTNRQTDRCMDTADA